MSSPVQRAPLTAAKRVLFALLPTLFLLGSAEVILRWTDAANHCSERLAKSLGVGGIVACDPILGVRLQPTEPQGRAHLNSAGFRTHEFTPKAAGVYRVLSIGDSCTFGMTAFRYGFVAEHPYPQRLEEIAAARGGAGNVEVLNAGIGGYDSYQGLMLLRTRLRDLEPDLITVRFGWNDHFMSAQGAHRAVPGNVISRMAQDLLLQTQLYRFAMRLGNELQVLRRPGKPGIPTEWHPGVPIAEFKGNLRRIVEAGTGMGARVWLLTAPDPFSSTEALNQYEALPPDADARRVLSLNALPSFQRLMEIHRQYVVAVRDVGSELGVPVVDMAAAYAARPGDSLFSLDDPVHPLQKGYDFEAEILYERLLAQRQAMVHQKPD